VVESLLSRRASHASTAGRVSDAMHLRRAA
jgi:hypothetical protein